MNKRITIGLFGLAALASIAAGARGIVAQTSTTGPTFYRNGTQVPNNGPNENPYGQPGSDPAAAFEQQYEGGFDPNEQHNGYTGGYNSYDPLSGSEWPPADQPYPGVPSGVDQASPGFQGGYVVPDVRAPADSLNQPSDVDTLYEEYMRGGDQPTLEQMEQTDTPEDVPMEPEPEEELKGAAPRGFGPSMITWGAAGVAIVVGIGMTLFMMKKKPAAAVMQAVTTQPPVGPQAPAPSAPTVQYAPTAPLIPAEPTPAPTTLQTPPSPPPTASQPPSVSGNL